MIHVGEIVSHMQMERHHVKDRKGVKLTCSHFSLVCFLGIQRKWVCFQGDVGGVH